MRVLISIAILLAISSCGVKTTITLTEAERKLESHFQEAVAQLPPEATLKVQGKDSMACDDPTDQGPTGRKFTDGSYQIENLDPTKFPQYFDTIMAWWLANGYRVLADKRPDNMYVWVENDEDAFRLSLKSNDVGGFYINGSSPCVWTDGTPAPE